MTRPREVHQRRAIVSGAVFAATSLVALSREPAGRAHVPLHANRTLDRLMIGPQQLGRPVALVVAGVVRPREATCTLACIKLLEYATKYVVRRERPLLPDGNRVTSDRTPSYPSGHSATAAAIACLLAPGLSPRLASAVSVGAVFVGYGRVHRGAHFPLDVIGGIAMGVFSANLALAAFGTNPGNSEPTGADPAPDR